MKYLLIILIVCTVTTLTGCSLRKKQTEQKNISPSSAVKNFLALGDSYTIGQGVDPEARWPNQLVAKLRSDGLAVSDPKIIAQTGWTTTDLESAIEKENSSGPYDLVTLLIGVNDQYQGASTEEYTANFKNLLQKSIELAGKAPRKVLVISIPDWGVSPFAAYEDQAAIARSIDNFNAINKVEVQTQGVHYVDITSLSRLSGNDLNNFAADGLHPSAKQHAAWAEAIAPVAKKILQQP